MRKTPNKLWAFGPPLSLLLLAFAYYVKVPAFRNAIDSRAPWLKEHMARFVSEPKVITIKDPRKQSVSSPKPGPAAPENSSTVSASGQTPRFPKPSSVTPEGPWVLDKWTADLRLPPGSYEANDRTIEIAKDRKISIESGTMLAKARFNNLGGANWEVAGSFFRDVQISGELGVKFAGKDTAFENVEMRKGGGWFQDRWSTRWRFENCVFGKKLMRPTLGITDYSVHAERCTFYDLELPVLKYKRDPSEEAQSEELRFANCRFVGCGVPESFLAATVDCVFQECLFSGTHEDWSKAKKPIAVTAYVDRADGPPASYENGNLKVTFKLGGPAASGASLSVTNSAGHLSAANFADTGAAIALGSVHSNPIPTTDSVKPPPEPPRASSPSPAGPHGVDEILSRYRKSLALAKGSNHSGAGFIATLASVNYLFTDALVPVETRDASFKMWEGPQVQPGAESVAAGHDILRMETQPAGQPFEVMSGVGENALLGDEIVVLATSEGVGGATPIRGRITGISPTVLEIDAPYPPGYSGSPIVHLKSGKVVGVAVYRIIRTYNPAAKEVFNEPLVRRFGYRLDSVKTWQPINSQILRAQALEMEKIEAFTEDLDALARDMSKNHNVTVGAHKTPVLKNLIDAWSASRTRRMSAADLAGVDKNFVSFLRVACQSDVTAARQRMTLDCFQRALAAEQKTRAEIAEIFPKAIKAP